MFVIENEKKKSMAEGKVERNVQKRKRMGVKKKLNKKVSNEGIWKKKRRKKEIKKK